MVVHLISPNNRYDMTYLRNYAVINVKDRLERIQGVGLVKLFGSGDYSMRVWLDPEKVAERHLTAAEVVKAIREQNVQVAAGVIGQSPSLPGTDLQLSVNDQGQAIPGQLCPAARWRHAGPQRGRDPPHVGDRAQASGRGIGGGLPGPAATGGRSLATPILTV
jgi:multidrug efflux pump subunit AcrB